MFARRISLQLKPNSTSQFNQKMESEILPMLRKQKGFQDEITFVAPAGKEVFVMSLWDNQESAEAYNRTSYEEVPKLLAQLVEGTPKVESYNVSSSTWHKIGTAAAA
jgi:heme-degrading monooxygenase HmoA